MLVVFLSARVSEVEEEVADGGAAGGSVDDAVLVAVAVVLVVRAERRWRWWLILCKCVTEEVQLIEGAVDALRLFRSVGWSDRVLCWMGWVEVKERMLPVVVKIRFDPIILF